MEGLIADPGFELLCNDHLYGRTDEDWDFVIGCSREEEESRRSRRMKIRRERRTEVRKGKSTG